MDLINFNNQNWCFEEGGLFYCQHCLENGGKY
jgi:hypothetical protein